MCCDWFEWELFYLPRRDATRGSFGLAVVVLIRSVRWMRLSEVGVVWVVHV